MKNNNLSIDELTELYDCLCRKIFQYGDVYDDNEMLPYLSLKEKMENLIKR